MKLGIVVNYGCSYLLFVEDNKLKYIDSNKKILDNTLELLYNEFETVSIVKNNIDEVYRVYNKNDVIVIDTNNIINHKYEDGKLKIQANFSNNEVEEIYWDEIELNDFLSYRIEDNIIILNNLNVIKKF